MDLKRQVEGFHNSFLEGLRTESLARARSAVRSVGALLRDPGCPRDEYRREEVIRWMAYDKALDALENARSE